MIVLVEGIIVLSNCSLFLIFHIWESIVIVNVCISFIVLGGNDNAEIVSVVVVRIFFSIRFLYFWK